MSLFSNKQMRIIFIYCVIIILVICGIITARHKKTSSDSIVKTTKTNNETSESSDTQHTSDNTPNTDRLPPYNSSNQGNGIGGGAIMGNCSIGSRKLPIYCVDLSKKTNLDTSKKYVSISFDAAWGDEDTIKILDILDKYNINLKYFFDLYYISIVFLPVAFYFMTIIFENGKVKFKWSYILLFIIRLIEESIQCFTSGYKTFSLFKMLTIV